MGFEYNHESNLVSIAEIEQRTGIRFFDGYPNREALVTFRAQHLWPVETRYWDSTAPCRGQGSTGSEAREATKLKATP